MTESELRDLQESPAFAVGMYGGSFDPLHVGHIHDILKAASLCGELYIALCWNKIRDSVPYKVRYRWLLNSMRHMPNVRIVLIEDDAQDKAAYDDAHWREGAGKIRSAVGKPISAVFCGSDYEGTGRFEALYPGSTVVYFDRTQVPVSSSEIRSAPARFWSYIPKVCRPWYVTKVLVVGSESTGKSMLVQNLALAYNTNYVSEVGRETCDYAGGEELMTADDLYENVLRQKTNVMDAVKEANRVLFVDTDAITTLFYADFLLDNPEEKVRCRDLAQAVNAINEWDMILFLEPTVEFVQDGTRSEQIASDRETYSTMIKNLLDENGVKYACLAGSHYDRLVQARELLGGLGINTSW